MGLQRLREVDDGARLHHVAGVAGRVGVVGSAQLGVVGQQRQLAIGSRLVGVERAVQVALDEVAEVERALAGQREVGGEDRVRQDAVDGPAPDGQRVDGRLEVMPGLGRGGVGEPGGERGVVVRTEGR